MNNTSRELTDPLNSCVSNWMDRNTTDTGAAGVQLCRYSDEQMFQAYMFYTFSFLILLFVCTIGNVLSLAVLLRCLRKWRTSARCYMVITAIADLGVLWLGLPSCIVNIGLFFKLPYYSVSNLPTIMIMGGITSWGQQACMRWSDWVLVAFSMERSLTIINPYRLEPLQRVATAQIITAFLLILSLAYGMFAFVKRYLYYIHWINDISAKLDNAPAWYPGWDEVDSAAKVIVQIVTFLLILIPSVILIVFLARHRKSAISTMRLQQKKPLRVTVKRSSSRSKVEINIILLSSAVLFLVTRSPSVVKTCLFQLANLSFDWSVIYFVSPFTDVAVYAGYSFTFFIYLLTERNFRENFLRLISPFRSDNTYIRRTGTKRCGEHFQMGLSTSAWAASACVERPTTSTWCRS